MPNLLQRVKSFIFENVGGVMGLVSSGDYSRGFSWNKSGSISLYEKSLYTSAAIRKRAEKTGQIKFQIKNSAGEIINDNKEAQEWLNLLNRPNEHHTGAQFWELAQKYYDTVGACYIRKSFPESKIFKIGEIPSSLEILRADLVTVNLNQSSTSIESFSYTGNGTLEKISPDEIIYWFRPSMRNPILGESLIGAAVAAIESEYQISRYHANVLKNGGKLESIFKVKNLKTQKQLDELEERFSEKFADAKKFGRPLFMGGDIENITTALSPSELAYLDTKVSNYKDLATITGVPKELLANTDGATYQNADAAIRIFLREVAKPNMESLATVLDWRLIPAELWLDIEDPTPEDREEVRKDMETANKIQALTTNEKREKLGLDPNDAPESEAILVPFSLRPLGDLPPKPEETPPAQDEGKRYKSTEPHPLRDKRTREVWGKAVEMSRREYDERMIRQTRAFFKAQEQRVLDSLKGKRKIAVEEVFNEGLEISVAKSTLAETIREIFMEQGDKTAETFDFPTFSMTQAVEQSLKERSELFTTSIIATQKKKLQKQFQESTDAQEPRAKLVERIHETYSEITHGWAEVIARTEVHAAVSSANLQAYHQGGITIKIWTAVMDDKTRAEHRELDGEERGLDEEFSNGLQYPSEPNCRCTI